MTDDIKCMFCNAVYKYNKNDIVLIINIRSIPTIHNIVHINDVSYEVLCKGECHHYINIGKYLTPSTIEQIKAEVTVDRMRISCPECRSVHKMGNGQIITQRLFLFKVEQIVFNCRCCHTPFYLDTESYTLVTNFIRSKMIDQRLDLTL